MTNHLSLSGTKGFPGMHPGAKTRAVPAQVNLMIDHLNSVPDRGKRKNKGPKDGCSIMKIQEAKLANNFCLLVFPWAQISML